MLPKQWKSLTTLVIGIVLLFATITVSAQDTARVSALSFIAETYNVPVDQLETNYNFQTNIAGFGPVTFYKVTARDTGNSYGAVVGRRGYSAWTPEEFQAVLAQAQEQQFGKLDQALAQRYEETPEAAIPVAIWLRTENALYENLRGSDYIGHGITIDSAEPPVIEEAEGADAPIADKDSTQLQLEEETLQQAREAIADAVAAIQTGVVSRLTARGIEVEVVEDTPLLMATLSHEQVLEVSEDPDVILIEADDIENVDLNNSATSSHRAPAVWMYHYTGVGSKVAILEDSRAFNSYWFPLPNSRVRVPGDANVDNHATRTMGNVGSRHALYTGMSPRATLYSANATTYGAANLRSAANWAAITQNVHIINNSWGPNTPSGCLSSLGRFFDYRVLVNAPLVTFAAGNSGNFVNDHAMGYNLLAVGAVDDFDNDNWSGDVMAGYSSRNEGTGCSPSNIDKQKPDVSAVGSRILSTNLGSSPAVGGAPTQGTSFAAPMVAGEAALLIDKNPSLAFKPEALRAIIMASAVHNIEGSSRLSEVDGAGAIDAYSAYLTVNSGRWLQQTINPQTWTGTNMYFYARSGEKIRCVVAWTSHPNSTYTTDPLPTDIDLRLYNPSGSGVTGSYSINNSYEILEFTANATGTWRCRSYRYSTTPGTTYEYIGMAVYRNHQVLYEYP